LYIYIIIKSINMRQTRRSTGGTSFHDTVFTATVADLRRILGEPSYSGNDGQDKTNFEWEMETEDGEVFTVYDWKEHMPIGENAAIDWHIGGHSRAVTDQAFKEIINDLNPPEKPSEADRREAAELILDYLAIAPDFETARECALVSAARLKQHYGAKYDSIIKEIKSFKKG
jgi:hypothetical protein